MSCIRTDLSCVSSTCLASRCSSTKPGTKPAKIAETRMCAIARLGENCARSLMRNFQEQ